VVGLEFDCVEVSVSTYDALRVQCHKLLGGLCPYSHVECYKPTDVSGDAVTTCLLHVYHTETRPNLSKRPGSEPAARRGTHTHTHTHARTHIAYTLRLSFRHIRRPRTDEVRGISQSCFVCFGSNFNVNIWFVAATILPYLTQSTVGFF